MAILAENRFRFQPRSTARVIATTAVAAMNSLSAAIERARFAEEQVADDPSPPVFVLGHWRSGTTLLHTLLAQDEQFVAPDLYQVLNPHAFLYSRRFLPRRLVLETLPDTRGIDGVAVDLDQPQEDEFAALHGGIPTSYLVHVWPRNSESYAGLIDSAEADQRDVDRWLAFLEDFVRRLTFGNQRIPLLKSPQHTARIDLLLRLYPSARFVFIHRDPVDVYLSTQKLYAHLDRLFSLQGPPADRTQIILSQYVRLHQGYYDVAARLRQDQLVEIAYADLVARPGETLGSVYSRLGLDGFSVLQPKLPAIMGQGRSHRRVQSDDERVAAADILRPNWGDIAARMGYAI